MSAAASHKRNLEAYIAKPPAVGPVLGALFDEAEVRRRFADFYADCVRAVPNSPDVPAEPYRYANEAGEFTRLVTAAEDRYVRMLKAFHGL